MSPIEIRPVPNYRWRMALIAFTGTLAIYFYLGYMPVVLWFIGGVSVVLLFYSALRRESSDPCVILDDVGVWDKRLQVGVISWDDIRQITIHDVHGGEYVSLELHDQEKYQARQPQWLRLASKSQRLLGMSPISISTSGLDMDMKTLANLIHEGCEMASRRRVEITS